MARTNRYPLVLWQTHDAAWSGRLLDDLASFGAACGPNPSDVMRQLRDCLDAADRSGQGWLLHPGFLEPTLRTVKIQAVPEYETPDPRDPTRRRILPCPEAVTLRLPCVVGRRESGLLCAMLPTLNVEFELTGGERLEEMALHYARQALKGLNPSALLRHLPPRDCRLDTVSFTPWRRPETTGLPALEHLPKVAEHAASPALRRHSRTWERDAEVAGLESRLRQEKGSVLLVGGSGSGKTAVLCEAARRAERQPAGAGPAPKRFWITSGSRLIAGMRWLGQWQEQLEKIIEELRQIEGVLCAESLQELLRLGGRKAEDSLAAFFIPYLQTGEVRMVVEATPEEVDACERTLPGFLDAFSVMRLAALSPAQEAKVLQSAAQSLSDQGSLEITPEAAREAGRLCRRFQPYAGFPGAPLGHLHEAAARARETGAQAVGLTEIRQLFAETTGLPAHLMDETKKLDPAGLRAWFHERLVAQPRAVDAVCRAVLKFKAGLQDPRRPLAVLLFTGPTGTGKTQLAKTLGDCLFPHRKATERLVRLDMSEYAGHDAARRLLGEPMGEPSDLVRRMRQNPFTVLLLDEVEKASPEVFDTLMNVFDEGRLTDTLGRTTWFRSTVVIMTSNLGTRKGGVLGFAQTDGAAAARVDATAAARFFRPEFFNRLDEVVTFDPLERSAVEAIARREVAALAEREGLRDRGITLHVSPALLALVCERGLDPVYGARPLQRRVEELIVTPVARWLVARPQARGGGLHLDWDHATQMPVIRE